MQDHVIIVVEKDGFLYVITKGGSVFKMELKNGAYWEIQPSVPLQELDD